MYDVRRVTNLLYDAMEQGLIRPETIVTAALSYLSEAQVEDMARANDWLYILDSDDDDED